MLQVNRSKVNTASNATLNDVIALTSVTSCTCVNTISPTFVTSTDSYSVSGDATATGTGSQINLTPTYDVNNDIAQSWADTYLVGKGWNGSDIAGSFYYQDASGATGSGAVAASIFSALGSGSVTTPSIDGGGQSLLGSISVAGSGAVSLPQPVGNGASIITNPTAAGSGTATLPQPTGTGSVAVGSITVNGSGSATIPAVPFGDGDVALLQPNALGAGSVTQPAPIGNGLIIFNPINISGAGSTTQPLPEPTKIVNVTVQGARINTAINVEGRPSKVIKVKGN